MSSGKYLSLEEAQKQGKLDRFAKEHPGKADLSKLEKLIGAMAKTPESADQTSRENQGDED